MDFKKVLQDWKDYQKHKLKLLNSYPCMITYSFSPSKMHGNLSFVGSGEDRYMLITDPNFSRCQCKILIKEILKTTLEGNMIRFTLLEERLTFVKFGTKAMQIAAYEVFSTEKEEFSLTPPNSGNDDWALLEVIRSNYNLLGKKFDLSKIEEKIE